MITAEQWKKVKDNKKELSEITNKEIQVYLEKGGVITRREKGGIFTYWELGPDGKLKEINKR